VDVWTGWSDRHGHVPWSEDTGAMVFSATKGVASTVIHRLVGRGLIDYDAPVAQYWTEFGANGKADITVREMMGHRAGLSHLNGVGRDEVMDHLAMEARLAAAPASRLRGKPAYHALTYGWLLSGLARSVTGKGMRQLIRDEVAEPLNTDGLHLGRPPADSPTRAAQIIHPQFNIPNPLFNLLAPRAALHPLTAGFGALYFPGAKAVVQGNVPLLDSEIPAANGVATARGLARMYGALANGGQLHGTQFLSPEITAGLVGRPSLSLDHSVLMPMSFHLGYHGLPFPGVLPGFGHVGLGGSLGWAIPDSGVAIGFAHNRLLTPFVVADQAGFVATAALVRRGAALAEANGYQRVEEFGAAFDDARRVAG
jgi:CubicO group peptidase (beta-lactamase class C family)